MKQPQFILNKDWAIDLNPLNWILLKATHAKTGERSGWKISGYYSTVQALLKDLHGQIMLSESGNVDLVEHINHALLVATANLTAFSALVDAMGQVPDKAALCGALRRGKAA